MKTYNLRFLLEADMNITIEAESEQDALDKLYAMDVRDIVEEGYINESDVKEEEVEGIIEDHMVLKVKCTDIEWDQDDLDDNPLAELPEEVILDKVYVDNYNGEIDDTDIEEAVGDELTSKVGFGTSGFRYEVLEELN